MYKSYISVYLRNAEEGPSCYYRIMQYINEIHDFEFKINNAFTTREYRANINFRCAFLKKIYQLFLLVKVMYRRNKDIIYDKKNKPICIIISREIFPRFVFPFLLKKLSDLLKEQKVIWDFDDDIVEFGEISKGEMKCLEKYADKIIVTHQYLQKCLPDCCHYKTRILPTTDKGCKRDELPEIISEKEREFKKTVKLVWVGTSNNLEFLDIVIEALDRAACKIQCAIGKMIILNVVCNVPYRPDYETKNIQIKNYRWSREISDKVMRCSHVGIMPLKKSKITEGKGSFKLIQYLSYGIPVIASPVGFNNDVVDEKCGFLAGEDNEWLEALTKLASDKFIWRAYAQAARYKYEMKFSYNNNLSIWEEMLEYDLGNGNKK